jgi:hypothetical protein
VFRGAAGLTLAVIAVLIFLTQERNRVYATPGGVWLDVIENGRDGTRAYWNLAAACDDHEAFDAAIEYADEVVARNPGLDVYDDLASSRLRKGDAATAERYLRHAVDAQTDAIDDGRLVAVRNVAHLALVLHMQGKTAEAKSLTAEHFEHVRSTLGDDHPWTRKLMAIRAGTAADGDGARSDR